MSVNASIVKISPEEAREMLQANLSNRAIRPGPLSKYRRDMEEGRWVFNGEAIKLDGHGNILDGQHRLTAVAGMPEDFRFKVLLVTGLPSEAQDTMDQGAKRSPADQLRLHGVADSQHVAAVVLRVLEYTVGAYTGNSGDRHSISSPRITEWAMENPGAVQAIQEQHALASRVLGAAPGVVGAAWHLLAKIDSEDADEFFNRLAIGDNLAQDNPIFALRARLFAIKQNKIRMSDRAKMAYIFYTWNLFRRGKKVTRIQAPQGGWNSSNFPTPI